MVDKKLNLKEKVEEAVHRLKGLYSWSDRLGSDEYFELMGIITLLDGDTFRNDLIHIRKLEEKRLQHEKV
tara:strand:- start:625 stop:834 length:210 start_codon:yes stop_codon:yes gene_type:complete